MARSQAQRDAQINAMQAARGAAAKRAEAKRRLQMEQADEEKKMAEHLATNHAFGWSNWEYAEDYKSETRTCRVCGATETRALRL